MRGASSADGKLHGNVQLVDSYNKHKKQLPRERGGHSGGVHEEEGHDEIKQVVAEHGPAHRHIIDKREDGDGFSSETHHEDGHVHHHDHHPTLEHAHEHGTHAFNDADHINADQDSEGRMNRRHLTESSHGTSAEFMADEE